MMPGTVALELKLLVPDENVDPVGSSGSRIVPRQPMVNEGWFLDK